MLQRPGDTVPEEITVALEPNETVEGDFRMHDGLEIYATGRRFFGRRGGQLIDIRYAEVSEASRRTADWRTWRGIARIVIGIVFAAAGVLTGFGTLQAAMISLGFFLIGGAMIFLGIYRRDNWVELKIDRREPPPSFGYVAMFLPFWLLLQSRKRYRVSGDPEEVDAFHEFLTARVPNVGQYTRWSADRDGRPLQKPRSCAYGSSGAAGCGAGGAMAWERGREEGARGRGGR